MPRNLSSRLILSQGCSLSESANGATFRIDPDEKAEGTASALSVDVRIVRRRETVVEVIGFADVAGERRVQVCHGNFN